MVASRARGITLLELMVATLITAILLLAMTQIMVVLSNLRQEQRRVVDRTSQLFVGLTLMERSVENGGYHVPSARFAFRSFNNVVAGQSYGGLVVGGCDAGCIVEGTDVLEVSEGHPGNLGEVRFSSPDGGMVQIILGRVGPLPVGDVAPRVFYFGDTVGRTCIGRGAMMNATDNDKLLVTMLDRDRAAQAPGFYSTTSPAPSNYDCPAAGMWVGAEERRTRFFVARVNTVPTLFSQDAFAVDGGSLQELAPGVDNMQLVPLTRSTATGVGCTAGVCECNVTGNLCQFTGGPAEVTAAETVVGVEVRLAARGELIGAAPLLVPPILADEPAFPADRVPRQMGSQVLFFRNLAMGGR